MTKKKKSVPSTKKIVARIKKTFKKGLKDFQKASLKQKIYIFLIAIAFMILGIGLYASSMQRTTSTSAQTPPVECSVEATLCDVDQIESCIEDPNIECDLNEFDVNQDLRVNQEDLYLCQVCTSSVIPACSALCNTNFDCTQSCGETYQCIIPAHDCGPEQVCPTQGPGRCHPIMNAPSMTPTPTPQAPPFELSPTPQEPLAELSPTPQEPLAELSPTPPGQCNILCYGSQDCIDSCGENFKCTQDCPDTPGAVCTQEMGTCVPIAEVTGMPTPTLTDAPFCQTKPLGDADCDGDIDLTDFNEWRVEYRALVTEQPDTHTSDIDNDGSKWDANFDGLENAGTGYPVDLTDFNTWRSTYIDRITQ